MVKTMMFNGGSMVFTEDYITVNYGEITVCNDLRCVFTSIWVDGALAMMGAPNDDWWGLGAPPPKFTEECISSRYPLERNTPVETLWPWRIAKPGAVVGGHGPGCDPRVAWPAKLISFKSCRPAINVGVSTYSLVYRTVYPWLIPSRCLLFLLILHVFAP